MVKILILLSFAPSVTCICNVTFDLKVSPATRQLCCTTVIIQRTEEASLAYINKAPFHNMFGLYFHTQHQSIPCIASSTDSLQQPASSSTSIPENMASLVKGHHHKCFGGNKLLQFYEPGGGGGVNNRLHHHYYPPWHP